MVENNGISGEGGRRLFRGLDLLEEIGLVGNWIPVWGYPSNSGWGVREYFKSKD